MHRRFLALSAVATLSACGGGDASSTPDITRPTAQLAVRGTWIGSTAVAKPSVAGATQTISLTLANANGVVTGTGSWITSNVLGDPLTLSVSAGTYAASMLALSLKASDGSTFSFNGVLSATGITGTASGLQFTSDAFTLQNTSAGTGAGTPATVTLSGSDTVEMFWSGFLFAQSKDKFGNYLALPVTWSSSLPSVAAVNQFGLIDGISTGIATITATVTLSGVTAKAEHQVTIAPSFWVGTWTLATTGGQAVPVTTTAQGITTRVVARTLELRADKTGTWSDSTLSSAACPAGSPPGSLCSAGGRANVTWSFILSTLTVTAVPGSISGQVASPKEFSRSFFSEPQINLTGTADAYTRR